MIQANEQAIREVVREVLAQLGKPVNGNGRGTSGYGGDWGVFETVDQAVAAAKDGFVQLSQVGLAERRNHYPAQLSGGQQQRVAIARALAMKPEVILFDEVTSSLDPELTGEVLAVMEQLASGGQTMIVVTHEMGFARHVGHRLVFMDRGRIVEQGHPATVLSSPQHERTQRFLSRVLHAM